MQPMQIKMLAYGFGLFIYYYAVHAYTQHAALIIACMLCSLFTPRHSAAVAGRGRCAKP
jgi:hypothetical protein